ncbi:MAG: capsule assembly Wzi family protein [Rhodothermales bacterium]
MPLTVNLKPELPEILPPAAPAPCRGLTRALAVRGAAILALCALWAAPASAQLRTPSYSAGLFAAGAGSDPLPYYLTANRFGVVDPFGVNAGLRAGAHAPYDGGRKLDYAYGIEGIARAGETMTAHLHEAYVRGRYGPFELSAGRWEQTLGVVDPTLTAGSMIWSANTSPLPRVTIAIPRYTPIPWTHRFAFIRGHLSHGWFEDDRFVRDALLHEKSFYLRLFSEKAPIQLHGGVTHAVIWAGTHPNYGKLPGGIANYWRIFFVQEGNEEAPENEIVNVLGNTIGSYDFSVTMQVLGLDWLIYRHFYIETGPSLRYRNPWDGMWGFSLKRQDRRGILTGLLYEHANTKRQGAQYSEGEPFGVDNYYNNVLYRGGWVYHGRTIGLPLLAADGRRFGVVNNIVLAHHVGIEGNPGGGFSYRAFMTYSRNYGADQVFEAPDSFRLVSGRTDRLDQYSMLFELTGPLWPAHGLSFTGAVAVDAGSLYARNAGVLFGVTWRGP